jgi:hypothetical protein
MQNITIFDRHHNGITEKLKIAEKAETQEN